MPRFVKCRYFGCQREPDQQNRLCDHHWKIELHNLCADSMKHIAPNKVAKWRAVLDGMEGVGKEILDEAGIPERLRNPIPRRVT